jgi:CMP/dCMP kinase
MIIAVDGPAASGKGTWRASPSTTALPISTPARCTGPWRWPAQVRQVAHDEAAAVEAAGRLDRAAIADDEIRQAGLGEAASIVAAFPAVREQMLGLQRNIASARRQARCWTGATSARSCARTPT